MVATRQRFAHKGLVTVGRGDVAELDGVAQVEFGLGERGERVVKIGRERPWRATDEAFGDVLRGRSRRFDQLAPEPILALYGRRLSETKDQ